MATIFVFGFDLTEASQIRRIRSLRSIGHNVHSATFIRNNMNVEFAQEWPNRNLGQVKNERFLRRIVAIAGAIIKVTWRPGALTRSDLIVARNFDMLAIAWASRQLRGRRRTPLVYECLDIHALFTRTDNIGRTMRWLERRLLARADLLLVSSPAFLSAYFGPVQRYRGKSAVVENKLWFDGPPLARPRAPRPRPADLTLTVGWVGSIRCQASLRLLMAAADAMGRELRIAIYGNIHRHAVPDFDEQVGSRANVAYSGPYQYPDGLSAVYQGLDLVWAQDLWQRGANSDWLLPNRIYEASWFGCPSIAVAGTETGRRIEADRLGFTIAEATPQALVGLLRGLSEQAIFECAAGLLARPEREFRLLPIDIAEALRPVLGERGGT